MSNFFGPLRRKVGAVALVIALGFTAAWMRSDVLQDDVSVPINRHIVAGIMSSEGYCHLFYERCDKIDWMPHMLHWITRSPSGKYDYLPSMTWYYGVGFGFGEWRYIDYQGPMITIPYSYIVIPSTLLSTWLLLSKGRVRKPNSMVESDTSS